MNAERATTGRPAPTGDPLRPALGCVTPAETVAALSVPDRRRRVVWLINQAHRILNQALTRHGGNHEITATCLLWSGGRDSNTLAHLMRTHVTHAVHANTGIGIDATREFVRDTCRHWGLPLIEKHPPPGSTYRELVLAHGFPGPGHHHEMYQRLKERCFRAARADLVRDPRRQRVVFLAGRRRAESPRRAQVPLHERTGSIIWVSPLAGWTALDLNTYRTLHPDVPHNPVTDLLHYSGECLCGAFARPGELDEIRFWFPDTAAHIDQLAEDVRNAGIGDPYRQWGWGAHHPHNGRHIRTGRLCGSCAPTGPATAHRTDTAA